jgi:hypothetical protein
MSIRELLPRFAAFSLVAGGAILSLPTPAIAQPSAQSSGFTVFAPNSKPYGLTIGEWSARWWEWVLSIPPGSNPQLDGIAGKASNSDHCDQGQQDPVWFLAGNYGGTTIRRCQVPLGRSLLFPIFNNPFGAGVGDCQTAGGGGGTIPCSQYKNPYEPNSPLVGIPALQAAAADQIQFYNPAMEVTLDGVSVNSLTSYRAASPVFSYWLTSDSLLNKVFGYTNPAGLQYPTVSDGYWVMVTPIKPGSHTIRFSAASQNPSAQFALDVTYYLIVTPN